MSHFTGCCCGRTERGYAAVPVDMFKDEWLRRKLRNVVHLTKAGCLGPCALANVASLVFDGRAVWFHSVDTPWHVRLIYDYIEAMVRADRFIAPTSELTEYVFYRAHALSGNTAFVDEIVDALEAAGLNALAVYTSSLRALDDGMPAALRIVSGHASAVISTLSFALGGGGAEAPSAFERLGIPVIQAITSGMAREAWEVSSRGLTSLDTAINVAIPEFDEWSGFAKRGTWGMLTSSWAAQFTGLCEDPNDQRSVQP